MTTRSYAPVHVPQTILDRFKKLPVATIWHHVVKDAGVPLPFMENVRLWTPGKRLAARAERCVFCRPALIYWRRNGCTGKTHLSASYGTCGPGDVLVADLGHPAPMYLRRCQGLQLKMNHADGIVTNGAIRDLDVMLE